MGEKIYVQHQDPAPLASDFKGFGLTKFEQKALATVLKEAVEVIETVDDWRTGDAGRLVFEKSTGKLLFGSETKWEEVQKS